MSEWTRVSAGLDRAVLVPGVDVAIGDCSAESDYGYVCTRASLHPGRHMASTGSDRVAAAWPGTHLPCLADLTAATS